MHPVLRTHKMHKQATSGSLWLGVSLRINPNNRLIMFVPTGESLDTSMFLTTYAKVFFKTHYTSVSHSQAEGFLPTSRSLFS